MSSVSQVFEKLVAAQVTNFFLDNHYLSAIQFGFRKGLSCQTALIKLTNFLFATRRDKLLSIIVTIDFHRAFDSLSHEILLKALQQHSSDAAAVEWFHLYLRGRSQKTK